MRRPRSRIEGAGRAFGAFLCLALLSRAPAVRAADRTPDDFLAGFVAAILERELHWERTSYALSIVDGVVTITLPWADPARREAAERQLQGVDGLRRVVFVSTPAPGDETPALPPHAGTGGERRAFPGSEVFRPLLADPKQPQFFVSLNGFTSGDTRYTLASVAFGETFGLYRLPGSRDGNGLQLSLQGAIFAQFNLSTASYDLVNADYVIGLPVTWRLGGTSLRFRLYHQSSHLGDELLLGGNPPERVNLSFEAVELILSQEWQRWRIYAGGEVLLHKEPDDLKPLSAHWGLEYRGSEPFIWNGRLLGGVDLKSLEEHGWDIDTSVKAGLEFGQPDPGRRRLRLMAVWYQGFDPRGQFYDNEVDYFGLELSLGF